MTSQSTFKVRFSKKSLDLVKGFQFEFDVIWEVWMPSKWKMSSFKWRVLMSGELMFLESDGNCVVTNTVTLLLWRHKTISHYDF